jgi:inorganic pyrophosphatase
MSLKVPQDRNSNEIRIFTGCNEEDTCPKVRRERLAETEEMILTILIEIPKGSRNKYEYDKERKIIKFDRMLFSAVHYPSDYGFIIDTLAEDTDPLDALVLVSEPTFPGCLIEAKPVGLFRMRDEKGPDEKILCVPMGDPHWNFIQELSDVPPHLLKEIEHFFIIYKELEKKKTGVEGWEDRESAIKAVHASRKRYQDNRKQLGASRI